MHTSENLMNEQTHRGQIEGEVTVQQSVTTVIKPYEIQRYIPERHHRLWVEHEGGRYLLDYADLVVDLPTLPSWAMWRACWLANDRKTLCWPNAMQQQFWPAHSAPQPRVALTLVSNEDMYRPLRDPTGKRDEWSKGARGPDYFGLNAEKTILTAREYEVDRELLWLRMRDLAAYVQAWLMEKTRKSASRSMNLAVAQQQFARYLSEPPLAEWIRHVYPTRRTLVQAGGLHLVEAEWLTERKL